MSRKKTMRSRRLKKYRILFTAFLLASCDSWHENHSFAEPTGKETSQSTIALPIDHNTWTIWRCKDGSTLKTRFKDHRGHLLELNYQGSRHVLIQQSNQDPLIYQNGRIAFFSDGQSAIIGQPESDLIYNSGCRIVR